MNAVRGRILRLLAGTIAVISACVWGGLPRGHATIDELALNGVFTATSDGQWAKTNERFRDEATVTSRWTVTSSCRDALDCTGQVASDLGWTAKIRYLSGMWFVTRTLEGWVRCPDGTSGQGQQIYKFRPDPAKGGLLEGWDTTKGQSGACGISRPLVIELPFQLVPAE